MPYLNRGLLEATEEKNRKAEAPEIQKDKGGKKRQVRIWKVKWADLGATAPSKETMESVVIRDLTSDVMKIWIT